MPMTLARAAALSLAFCVTAPTVHAQGMGEEVCDTTAGIVAAAQQMRADGDTENRATRKLRREYGDLGDNYRDDVIPLLANFVFIQPAAAMEQDLSAFWKQTCLTTDLSSVLPGQ